jgi:GNAT superfamily N-acetyltransferase
MKLYQQEYPSKMIKFTIEKNQKLIGRAYLYLIKNDLHENPYGLLEDLYVEEEFRHQGLGSSLVKAAIIEAKKKKCYKLIATSRNSNKMAHSLYTKLGFFDYGKEFRMDLIDEEGPGPGPDEDDKKKTKF